MSKRLSTTGLENTEDTEPWVLGFASSATHRQREAGTAVAWRETRLGGQPIWPPGYPGIATPHCALCGRRVVLVLQAFAPTALHAERILYVFACNSIRCADDHRSWSCIRLFPKDTPETSGLHTSDTSLFVLNSRGNAEVAKRNDETATGGATGELCNDDTAGDDSADDDGDQIELLLGLHALKVGQRARPSLRLQKGLGSKNVLPGTEKRSNSYTSGKLVEGGTIGSETAKASRDGPASRWLNSIPIEVDFEPGPSNGLGTELDRDVERLLEKYRASGTDSDDGVQWGEEPDEIESERSITEARFRDQIERAPGQLLRYNYNGKPLWPLLPIPQAPAPCACGGTRVFEVQMLASCIHYLQPDDAVPEESNEAGMNWAAAAVYTCQFDCAVRDISPVSSWVAVWEPVRVQPDSF